VILQDLKEAWDAQADEHNKFESLGLDEIVAFAQEQERAKLKKVADALPELLVEYKIVSPEDGQDEGVTLDRIKRMQNFLSIYFGM